MLCVHIGFFWFSLSSFTEFSLYKLALVAPTHTYIFKHIVCSILKLTAYHSYAVWLLQMLDGLTIHSLDPLTTRCCHSRRSIGPKLFGMGG